MGAVSGSCCRQSVALGAVAERMTARWRRWASVGAGRRWWALVGVGWRWWALVGVGGRWWALVGVGMVVSDLALPFLIFYLTLPFLPYLT